MIGKLKGYVNCVFDDNILFNVNDVCYIVYVDNKTLFKLSTSQTKIDIFIETIFRETGTTLFGFLSFESQVWFRQLIKLNGISGKIALSIMGYLDNENLKIAIATKDEKLISTVPGIGKKLANRIVNELEDIDKKISNEVIVYKQIERSSVQNNNIQLNNTVSETENSEINNTDVPVNYNLLQDAITAICSLGFNRQTTYNIVQKIIKNNPKIELDSLVKEGIKQMI